MHDLIVLKMLFNAWKPCPKTLSEIHVGLSVCCRIQVCDSDGRNLAGLERRGEAGNQPSDEERQHGIGPVPARQNQSLHQKPRVGRYRQSKTCFILSYLVKPKGCLAEN